MWPDAPVVRGFLARAWRRLAVIAAIQGAAIGLALATLWVAATWAAGWRPAGAAIGTALLVAAGLSAGVRRVKRRAVPGSVERRAPECRNLLITTAELLDNPSRVRPAIGAHVCHETSQVVSRLDLGALFPMRRALAFGAAAAAMWIAVAVGLSATPAPKPAGVVRRATTATVTGVRIDITPPDYARLPATSVTDPSRVEALAGSRIRVTASADAESVTLETIGGRQALARGSANRFSGEVAADADGFLAIQPSSADGRAGDRRLIGLDVRPDRPPVVRVTKPGHDLFLSTQMPRLSIGVESEDDLALDSLRLTYTKVSGAGENLQFKEGELPLRVSRASDRAWTAEGDLPLGAFGLIPGDMIVYRGVATDRRPGAPPVESDAFIISIVSPGEVAAEGFAVDDERDRYALSQQMVILKTERLSARRAALSSAALADEALNIAAEQRQVRAEFIFMMGGELADETIAGADLDETTEAMGEADLLAGRAQNQGRRDLLMATRSMSDAATVLATPDLAAALKSERAALAALQRAFSKNRYILRTLTQRESLDLARRLTGKFADIARDRRPVIEPPPNPTLTALRRALADLSALAAPASGAPDRAARAASLADAVLRIDPASEVLRQVSARLADAAAAIGAGRAPEVPALLDRAATDLSAAIRSSLELAPHAALTPEASRLSGSLADALAARRGGR